MLKIVNLCYVYFSTIKAIKKKKIISESECQWYRWLQNEQSRVSSLSVIQMVDFLRSSCSGFLSCDFTALTRLLVGGSSSSETSSCPLKMSLCLSLLLTPWVTLLFAPLLPWTTCFANRTLTQFNSFRKVSYIQGELQWPHGATDLGSPQRCSPKMSPSTSASPH